jgi:hypothetical protein
MGKVEIRCGDVGKEEKNAKSVFELGTNSF